MPDRKPAATRVRRTVRVDTDVLARAREILGTHTDAETIIGALDMLVFRDEVSRGIREMAGSESIRDIYNRES